MEGDTVDTWHVESMRRALAERASNGVCGSASLEGLIRDGRCAPIECELLDYKAKIDASDKIAVAELVKDIVAFHNAFGGYIVVGVRQIEGSDEFQVCGFPTPLDVEGLKSQVREFTGERIAVVQSSVAALTPDGSDASLSVLFVPKRMSGSRPASFTRDGPQKPPSKGAPIFQRGDIWFREHDATVKATGVRAYEMQVGKEHPLLERSTTTPGIPFRRMQNNLPDRSTICPEIIGREEALDKLWEWLGDDLSHAKVLAGEGGIGKSTIAYEFASRVSLLEGSPFEQVLWLSAKQRQFRPFRNMYEDVLETHFSSYEELLEKLCDHLAVLPDERVGADQKRLLRLIKAASNAVPAVWLR